MEVRKRAPQTGQVLTSTNIPALSECVGADQGSGHPQKAFTPHHVFHTTCSSPKHQSQQGRSGSTFQGKLPTHNACRLCWRPQATQASCHQRRSPVAMRVAQQEETPGHELECPATGGSTVPGTNRVAKPVFSSNK